MATTQPHHKTRQIDILIVGAGIGGTALASFLLLAQLKQSTKLNFHITILERSPSIRGAGQNIDIRQPGKALLSTLGVEDEVRSALTGEEGAMWIDTTGKAYASFGVDKTGESDGPTAEIEILRGRLAEILFKRCKELSKEVENLGGHAVDFVFGDYLANIKHSDKSKYEKVQVHFARSKEWRSFDVVVGADGLQSQTRRLAWSDSNFELKSAPLEAAKSGMTTDPKSTSSTNVLEPNEDPHLRPLNVYNAFFSIPSSVLSESKTRATHINDDFGDGWRRWYHASGRRSVMLRPADDSSRLTVLMIALDPEHKDRRFRSAAMIGDDRKSAVQKQRQLMSEYFQDAGWECSKLVEGMNAADDFYYDLVAQVRMDKWSHGRVCLLGDAAHCASPFSGMGTALALVGAYNLAGALTKHMSPSSSSQPLENGKSALSTAELAAVFAGYEDASRPLVTQCQKLPPGMPWLVHPETNWGVWVMQCIIGAIYQSGVTKLFVKLAGRSKRTSDEPQLVEWENL